MISPFGKYVKTFFNGFCANFFILRNTKEKVNMHDSDLIWNEQSREQILKTPVFRVMQTQSVSPKGETGQYITVEANDWCAIIPELGDDFLMVKQWRHGAQCLSIEFPGGVIENGETPLDAACRELHEETGFTANDVIHLGTMSPNPALFSNRMHFFLAKNLTLNGQQELDEDEFVNAVRIPKKEVFEKMGSSEYPHALMAAALNFYRQYKTPR